MLERMRGPNDLAINVTFGRGLDDDVVEATVLVLPPSVNLAPFRRMQMGLVIVTTTIVDTSAQVTIRVGQTAQAKGQLRDEDLVWLEEQVWPPFSPSHQMVASEMSRSSVAAWVGERAVLAKIMDPKASGLAGPRVMARPVLLPTGHYPNGPYPPSLLAWPAVLYRWYSQHHPPRPLPPRMRIRHLHEGREKPFEMAITVSDRPFTELNADLLFDT